MKISFDHYISRILESTQHNYSSLQNIGFYLGKSGALYALLQYAIIEKNQDLFDWVFDECDKIIEDINLRTDTYEASFSNGLSGFLYLLNSIKQEGIEDYLEVQLQLEQIIYAQMQLMFRNEEYDFLHQGLGLFYVLHQCNYFSTNKLDIDFLIYRFLNYLNFSGHEHFSLKNLRKLISLPHGLCGFVIMLKLMYAYSTQYKAEILDKINEVLRWVESSRLTNKYSLYSSFVNDRNHTSKASWCYGDLSVALMYDLINGFEGFSFSNKIDKIVNFNLEREYPQETGLVSDSSLCHGFLGNQLILAHLTKKYHVDCLDVSESLWIKLFKSEFAKNGGKLKFELDDGNDGLLWAENATLLFGSSGCLIALMYLGIPPIHKRLDFLFL